MENLRIDSTCIKLPKSANGGEKTGNKAVGLNAKIHAIVDGSGGGEFCRLLLFPGNDSDSAHAIKLTGMTDIAGSNLLGDKAYGMKGILVYIKEHGASVLISPKSSAKEPWEVDYYLYKEHHLAEYFFQKIKWFRRVATQYDKLKQVLSCLCLYGCYLDLVTLTFSLLFSNKTWVLFEK